MSRDTHRVLRYWLPVALYAGVIFYLSSLSHPELFAPTLLKQLGDKALHAIEYAVFGILSYRAFRYAAPPWAARYAIPLAIALAAAYGVTDEIHQAFVPMRESDGWDVLMDTFGATMAACGWHAAVPPRSLIFRSS